MKISQMIADLTRVLENDGDIKVAIQDEDGLRNYVPELVVTQKPKTLIVVAGPKYY